MSVEPPFQLKHTNVSRPRLSHSDSQQSIAASQAASEGYYSLSENTSSESDAPHPRYHTPPSHHRTPAQSHEHLHHDAEAPVTSLKGVGVPRQHQQPAQPTYTNDPPLSPSVSTIVEERPEIQEGKKSQARSDMDSDSLSTTPGMDSTPYIRFAIDQLTRDEEVRGSRMYPAVATPEEEEEDEYPVDRIVSDESLGYMAQEQQTQRRLSRYIPQKPARHTSGPSGDTTTERQHRTPYQAETPTQHVQKDVFVSTGSLPHAPLHFLPAILRPLWLLLFILLCVLMLIALIFSAVYSNRNGGVGLWNYASFGDNRYFVFEYLPTMLGAIIFLWLLQVQIALQRVIPFISMASGSYHQRSEAIFLQLYPMQFLLPKLEYFRAGHPRVGLCYLIFWLFSWTIPLLASSFNVRYDVGMRVWRWVAVQGVIWTNVALYILLILALLFLLIFLIRNETGLKWDPRSLADIITLLERSNMLKDYNGSETFEKKDWDCLRGRADKIGYWRTTKRPNDVFYGIGEEGAPTRRYSIEDGRIREKGPERAFPDPSTTQNAQRTGDFSIRMDIRSPTVRLRYLPWYLRDTMVIAWIVIALVLLIAFLVVSFVNSAVRSGFLPQVFARTNSAGFSASNFLYSFVPALIAHFLFLVVLTFDYSFRTLRPYISLASKGGATAEASLLIDYACRLPLSVTLSALDNQHYQTAILSLVSLCSITLPILAGGCFWTQYYPSSDVVRVAADLPGYYALCFFLALYAVSLFVLLPGRHRAALPHRSTTLAEIISWVYQSPIVTDRAFNRPQTKPELVTRLMGSAYLERSWAQSLTSLIPPSRDNLRGDQDVNEKKRRRGRKDDAEVRTSVLEPGKIKYGFGIHVGRDGLEHLGIDRVRRGGERSGRELVIWEEQNRKSWIGSSA
ncbi:hypothetical protein BU26DRAFT_144373 [Trematosphaeria pertusa]|uniref:Uncharacterized protein n=1 Tax=Trematosphaeria pertusa TaxID=390896 RepID=A0A6A6IWG1_9PLEO|nr:uncharacterized protein BU26DRAFT_144373 [Trematosphaeria pertusa]KAF2254734.1 hypothetical protein BU26DRAFT_144373 [Trematosphaeria pertusa]